MTKKEGYELGERVIKSEESVLSELESYKYIEACVY